MSQRAYNLTVATVFLIIAVLQLLRIVLSGIFGWTAQIEGWTVPLWPSWLAVVIAGALAWFGFRLSAGRGAGTG